jgi:hypothetical protein
LTFQRDLAASIFRVEAKIDVTEYPLVKVFRYKPDVALGVPGG